MSPPATARRLLTDDEFLNPAASVGSPGLLSDDEFLAPSPPPPSGKAPGAVARGLVSGLIGQNSQSMSDAFDMLNELNDIRREQEPRTLPTSPLGILSRGISDVTSGTAAVNLGHARDWFADLAKASPDKYQLKTDANPFGATSLDDAFNRAGELFGQGLASSLPSIVSGVGGSVLGGALGGPTGAAVGGTVGITAGSAPLNFGQTYRALLDAGVDKRTAAEISVPVGAAVQTLDTLSFGPIVEGLGGIRAAKAAVLRSMARRVAEEMAKGATREAVTEAAQQVIQDAAVSIAADKPFFTRATAEDVGQAALGGAAVGGVFGAAGGVRADRVAVGRPFEGHGGPPGALLSPDDLRSPISDDLISLGRARIASALEGQKALPAPAPRALPAPESPERPALPGPERSGATITEGQGFVMRGEEQPQRALPAPEQAPGLREGPGFQYARPEEAPARRAGQNRQGAQFRPVEGEGTPSNPVKVSEPSDLEVAALRAAQPTPAQAEAGNYRMGHVRLAGLDITIEVPRGGTRTGTDANGRTWESVSPAHYGYIKRTGGADGEQLDAYIGDEPGARKVFVVDQIDPRTGAFDEHKALIAFRDEAEALRAYDRVFNDGSGPARRGAVTAMSVEQFQDFVQNGNLRGPLAYKRTANLDRKSPQDEQNAQNFALSGAESGRQEIIGSRPAQINRDRLGAVDRARTEQARREESRRSRAADNTVDVITFLARNGGIRDDEGHDLKRGRDLQRMVPRAGPLIRRNGRSIDEAGELLHQHGYFGPAATTPRPTERQVLDLIESTSFERSLGLRPEVAAEQAAATAQRERDAVIRSHRADIVAVAKAQKALLGRAEVADIAEIMEATGRDAETAIVEYLERAALQDLNASARESRDDSYLDNIGADPFDLTQEAAAAPGGAQPREAPRESGSSRGRPEGERQDEGEREAPRQAAPEVRQDEVKTPTETTDAGEQTVIPGAERITDRRLAERRMEGRKTSDKEQKPADEGLFDTGARNQRELKFSDSARAPRRTVLSGQAGTPISSYTDDSAVKAHADYTAAKNGDAVAAARLVPDLVKPETITAARSKFDGETIFAPVSLEEPGGRNRIPAVLAGYYAAAVGAEFDTAIRQANRAFHTGAGPMERLIASPFFEGQVQAGRNYVIVDDVTVLGGTIAEMANHIETGGGHVVGVVTLVNASRTGHIGASKLHTKLIENRFGDVVRQELGIEPAALTAAEAIYIAGFRDADALRARILKSRRERSSRLGSKGVREQGPQDLSAPDLEAPREGYAPGAPVGARVFFQPETFADRHDLADAVRGRLDAIGLHDIGVQIGDRIEAIDEHENLVFESGGYYLQGVITLALDAEDWRGTLDHETVHALRDLGLFTKSEWSILESRARREWRAKYDIDARYPGLPDDKLNEEAVAEAFKHWPRNEARRSLIGRIIDKVAGALAAIRSAFRGLGFRSSADVFGRVETGEVGARARSSGGRETPQFSAPSEEDAIKSPVGADPFAERDSVSDALEDTTLPMLDRVRNAANRQAVEESFDRMREVFQDKFLPVLRTQERIERMLGRPLAEDESPYLGEELMTGRIGARIDDFHTEQLGPLLRGQHTAGISLDELETYLYARHAPERNAHISEINPRFNPGEGSGMTDEEAADIMAAVRASGKEKALKFLARQVDEITEATLADELSYELRSEQEVEALRGAYEHYVPLRGEADHGPGGDQSRVRRGSGVNIRGPESRRAFGRASKAHDILAYIIMQREGAIIRGETNRVARRFYDLVRAAPNPDFWAIDKITQKPVFNEASGLVSYRSEERIAAEDADYTVSLKIGGEEHRITMNRKNATAVRLARSMRNLAGHQFGPVVRWFGAINRWLSFANTGLNPEFVITNAFKDLQEGAFNLASRDIKNLVRKTLRDYPRALAGSIRGAFDPDTGGEWVRWFNEYRMAGGKVSFNRVDDINTLRSRLRRDIHLARPGITPRKVWHDIFDWIEKANIGVEQAIRLAAYKNAREAGLSVERSASLAKNLTVNFNRHGSYGPLINAGYLFYNAAVQGSATVLTALKSPTVRKLVGAAILAGFINDQLNSMLSKKDKDGELFLDKIDTYRRNHNLIFMSTSEDGHYLHVPLSYGYAPFFDLGRGLSELIRGRKFMAVASDMLEAISDSYNPVGGEQGYLNLLAPTIFDPGVDIALNRDYSGRKIRPDQPDHGPTIPESGRYFSTVSPVSKAVTDELNKITGGDAVRPGLIDVSPEVLDYLFGQAVGAAGAFWSRAVNLAFKLGDPAQEVTPNDIPLYRRLVGRKAPWVDKGLFYQRVRQVEQVRGEVKSYRERRMGAKALQERQQNKALLSLHERGQHSRQELSRINARRDALRLELDQGKLSRHDYVARMKALRERETAVIDRFNRVYIERVLKGRPGE